MENTNRDTAQNAAPQNDWRNAEDLVPTDASAINELADDQGEYIEDAEERTIYALAQNDDPDPDPDDEEDDDDEDDENDEDEDEDDENRDWGHVDPAENNSPFPDSNEPSAPGFAI